MAIPHDKATLLSAIDLNFEKLRKELVGLPQASVNERNMEGHAKGTQMSVADLVAYLVGWNELVLKWLDRDAAGEPIDFPETNFKWSELGLLAQKFYRDYEGMPFGRLVKRLEAAKDRIVSQIEARSDNDLYGRSWYGKWTMGRMIQFNTSSPYDNARARLRKWKKAQQASSR